MNRYYEHLYLENLNKNENIEMKIEAVKALGKIKSERAVHELEKIALNKENDISLRLSSILALTSIGNKNFIIKFSPIVSEENEDILELLIRAIGKMYAKEYLNQFEDFINYKSKSVKKEIINSLLIIDDVESVKILIKFYNDKDSEIKELVKYTIKNMQSFSAYIENVSEKEILNVLSFIPKEKAEKLIEKLIKETKDEKILNIVIKAIADLNLKDAGNILQDLFHKTDNKNIKIKILEAFEIIKIDNKKFFLLDILNDEDRDIKVRVLFSLGDIAKEKDVIKKLREIIKNKNEWWMTRKVAIMLIGENRIKSESDFLIEMLSEENDMRVSRTLIHELGELENKNALQSLRKFLETDELEIKKVTILSLSKLGDKDVLEVLLKDKEARDRLMPESLKAIINFNDERIISILTEIIENKTDDNNMINLALEGISDFNSEEIKNTIIKYVENKNNKREYRAKAIMLLAGYNDKQVSECLKNILKDNSEWWMMKKIAFLIIDEIKDYTMINLVTEYAVDIDERISKTAKKVAKNFYNDYFITELEKKNKKMAEIGKMYLSLL